MSTRIAERGTRCDEDLLDVPDHRSGLSANVSLDASILEDLYPIVGVVLTTRGGTRDEDEPADDLCVRVRAERLSMASWQDHVPIFGALLRCVTHDPSPPS